MSRSDNISNILWNRHFFDEKWSYIQISIHLSRKFNELEANRKKKSKFALSTWIWHSGKNLRNSKNIFGVKETGETFLLHFHTCMKFLLVIRGQLLDKGKTIQTFLCHLHTYMMKIKAVIRVSLDRDKIWPFDLYLTQ